MRLLLSLFVLGLAALATFILIYSIIPHVVSWQSAQSWVRLEATLINHEFIVSEKRTSDSSGDSYSEYEHDLTLQYNYVYEDKAYQANKLALNGISPSKQFLYKLKADLDAARRDNQKIAVWVNPNNAQESVLDRSFRWRGFDLVILFFVCLGVLGYCGVIELLRTVFFFVRPRLNSNLRKNAELGKHKTTTLYDRDTPITPIGWGILIFLCLPIFAGFRFPILNLIDGEIVLGIVPLVIGLAAVGLFVRIARMALTKMIKVGAVRVKVNQYPVLVGQRLFGYAELPTRNLSPSVNVYIRAGCDQHDHRKAKVKSKKLWGDSENAKLTSEGRNSNAHFDFLIPDNLPSADNDKAIKVNWWLELNIEASGKKTITKRYDDLAVFQMDSKLTLARDKRYKNNVVTKPKLWNFSTIFLTNGALLFGIFFFEWAVDAAMLVMLFETALIALLSPFLLVGLSKAKKSPKKTNSIESDAQQGKRPYRLIDALGLVIIYLPFTLGLLFFQIFVLQFIYKLSVLDLITEQDSFFAGLLNVFKVYNLWLPALAVVISMVFEWTRLSEKSKTVDISRLVNDLRSAPLMRMFITTFLMVFAGFILFIPDAGDRLRSLLFILIAFKLWIEYSLIRWGRLEV